MAKYTPDSLMKILDGSKMKPESDRCGVKTYELNGTRLSIDRTINLLHKQDINYISDINVDIDSLEYFSIDENVIVISTRDMTVSWGI